jgi:methylenetetrahydrofolate dehydrogenase (NADP+)/methenyltetrahydrofolate cyclohydrolase
VPAKLIDGKAIAQQIRDELGPRIASVRSKLGRPPGLAIVLVGDDPASHVYVRSKLKTAEESGMAVTLEALPGSARPRCSQSSPSSTRARHSTASSCVAAARRHGTRGRAKVFDAIDPSKDVDGFARSRRLSRANRAGFAPCTPAGVIEMLVRDGIEIQGKRAVVLGRSDIVGKPMAMLLLHRNATVTICHSRTRDLPSVAREADILVAAIGRPAMVTPDYVRPGAVVVDVGINRITDAAQARQIFANYPKRLEAFKKTGAILVGDVHPDVAAVAGALTPVPGGVGPLTIAMLMANTVKAAENRRK